MSRTSAGAYALPEAPFVAGTKALSARVNNNFADIATEMQDSVSRSGKGALLADLAFGGHKGTGLAAATASGELVCFEQVPLLFRGPPSVFTTATGGVILSLPSDCVLYELRVQDANPTAQAPPYLRFCFDGTGTNFASGATDYENQVDSASAVVQGFVQLGATVAGSLQGSITFSNFGQHYGKSSFVALGPSGQVIRTAAGFFTASTVPATHVLFGFVSTTMASGRVDLLGAIR
jgi:hypothetical protein